MIDEYIYIFLVALSLTRAFLVSLMKVVSGIYISDLNYVKLLDRGQESTVRIWLVGSCSSMTHVPDVKETNSLKPYDPAVATGLP